MKRASCGKSGITKSPSISFRLVGRKEGSGVVCPGAALSGERLDGIARNGPTSRSQFFILPVHESEADGDERGKPAGKFKRTTLPPF